MTPAPRYDVTVNVYLPGMFLSLGYVQAESYWAAPGPAPRLRWQPTRAVKTVWGQARPTPADWK
jgi:hypothetical protein